MSWFQTKDPTADREALASFVRTRVKAFATYLDRNEIGSEIVDISNLPFPKEELLKAICMLLGSGTLTTENQERLFQDGLLLANFQAGVGEHPLFPFGLDARQIDLEGMSADKLSKINPAGAARFDQIRPLVQADARAIGKRLRTALTLGRLPVR